VPSDPSTAKNLDAYRDDADRFIAELDEEYYLHFSGQKESLDVEQVFGRLLRTCCPGKIAHRQFSGGDREAWFGASPQRCPSTTTNPSPLGSLHE
jgi:hypothetical protein